MFSIIVPVFNVEKYLDKCISSLLQQNIDDYEIILINDASTDSSLNIMKFWESKDKKIKCFNKEKNSGLSDTRNIGINNSNGEYIIFVDSDDYVEPDFLYQLKKIIRFNNNPDVIYTGFYQELLGQKNKSYGFVSQKNLLFESNSFIKNELKNRNLYAAACFGIYKRKLLMDNKLYFESGLLHEDELWTPNVLCAAKSVYTSDICFYHYVRREESITKSKDKTKNGLDLLKICEKLENLSNKQNDLELKKLLNNHVAKLYMKAMSRGRLYRKEYKQLIDRFYPLKMTSNIYDKAKSILFLLNLKLYYKLDTKK